jgi:Na+:H+ antiporter, NhaA family
VSGRSRWAEVATQVATFTTALCAVVITALAWHRRSVLPPPPPTEGAPVAAYESFHEGGHRLGPADAPVTIVEFSDFQCPTCRHLHRELRALRSRFPTEVAVVYRHLPLSSIHPHAQAAAIASECAAEQGTFEAYHDALYESQASIGQRRFTMFAVDAGVPDTTRFADCLTAPSMVDRVSADIAAAERLNARSTPTVLINARRFTGSRSAAWLDSVVTEELRSAKSRSRVNGP